MLRLSRAAEPLVSAFSVAFTRPTFQRVVILFLGAILSLRHRAVTGMLRAAGPRAKGHWSDFHRVLCRRVWSGWPLAAKERGVRTEQRAECAKQDGEFERMRNKLLRMPSRRIQEAIDRLIEAEKTDFLKRFYADHRDEALDMPAFTNAIWMFLQDAAAANRAALTTPSPVAPSLEGEGQ